MAAISPENLEKVKLLYYGQKLSCLQIAGELGVSIDAVYYFMRHHKLDRRTTSENDAIRFAAKKPSFILPPVLTSELEKLKVIGTMLYWAEGAKSIPWRVDFANSDPAMVKLFMRFLREVCGVSESKLRGRLYCYANQNVSQLIRFWSNLTAIPRDQFTKPYVRHDFDPRKRGKMQYGLFHVEYYDKKLLTLILQWIKEYSVLG